MPFKGTPEALNEAMAGRIDWFFAPMVSALPLITGAAQLQALAVGTAKRSDVLPQVPTTVEAGVPAPSTCSGSACSRRRRRRGRSSTRLHDEVARS